jgi:hypothetical protein
MKDKVYVGDGVYVEMDHLDVVLTTEDGLSVTNRIVLDWDVVWRNLLSITAAYRKREEEDATTSGLADD